MELFQRYEEYKKKKETILIGSIWRDPIGEIDVTIIEVTSKKVRIYCNLLKNSFKLSKDCFLNHFTLSE